MRGLAKCDDPKEACLQVLRLYDSSSVEWQLGKTRVRNTVSLLFYYILQHYIKDHLNMPLSFVQHVCVCDLLLCTGRFF